MDMNQRKNLGDFNRGRLVGKTEKIHSLKDVNNFEMSKNLLLDDYGRGFIKQNMY